VNTAPMIEDAETEASSKFREIRDEAMERIKARPIVYAGIAAGAGFVLGGGLATRTTLRVLKNSASLILQMTVVPYLLTQLRDMLVEPAEQE
jgi:hypothetical protein